MNTLFDHIWTYKISFLVTFFVIFSFSYLVLVAVDFLPEEPEQQETAAAEGEVQTTKEERLESLESIDEEVATAVVEPAAVLVAALPVSITIDRLDKTIAVLNPTSRNIADLDNALLSGVVRHPDSATLAQEGNVFILGHSSYLPNVLNRNFQAFNGIQNLEWGDVIEVTTADAVYEYRVEKVYRARAQDVTVPIADTGNMLTLATCNSFGSVDDRYIVEAKQTSSRAI